MPTKLDPTGRQALTRRVLDAVRGRLTAARSEGHGEDGFLLVEVIISAMLVALVVVGTFNGFDVVNRLTTAQRQHEEAAVLAAASQEQLRSVPASVLQTLQSSPHSYSRTVQGTTYTITQGAELQPASKSTGACNVSQSSRQSGNAYRITSTVKWGVQEKTKRPPVVASSIITPPIGSSLEIDVLSSPGATTGVPGVTGTIKYQPEGSKGTATQSQTTGNEGCLLFGAIPSLEAEREISELLGYVTIDGKPKVPSKTVTLAPNYTVHDTVVYNRAGAIEANFNYNGATTAQHSSNDGSSQVTQTVTGDTFVALNTLMGVEPNFELGSTSYGAKSTIPYEVKTGVFQPAATSKTNLFPFTAEEGYWQVYAGDCTANNPEEVTAKAVEIPKKVVVKPGETTAPAVPTSYTTLNVYAKKEGEVSKLAKPYEALETTNSYPVLIDNLGCAGLPAPPVDETEAPYKHSQTTTTGGLIGGHLSNPFQPFGKEFTLCLSSSARNQTYKVKYANTALNGGSVNIYLPQRPTATVVAERKEQEATYKAEETSYKTDETKFKEYETKYKEKEKLYKEKEGFKEQNKVAETKKKEYEAKKAAWKAKKEQYEAKKKEYEKTFKSSYKTEYETFKKEYEKLETEYKTLETEYKTAEKQYEEYAKPKAEYESFLASYNTWHKAWEEDKGQFETAKKAFEKAKEEEKEGAAVTVETGTTCT